MDSSCLASYHNRVGRVLFWRRPRIAPSLVKSSTIQPPVAYAATLPIEIPATPAGGSADSDWTMEHMSVESNTY